MLQAAGYGEHQGRRAVHAHRLRPVGEAKVSPACDSILGLNIRACYLMIAVSLLSPFSSSALRWATFTDETQTMLARLA